jgi:hypothetical protein
MSEEKQVIASIVAADETMSGGEKPVDADELRLAQMGNYLCCQSNNGAQVTNIASAKVINKNWSVTLESSVSSASRRRLPSHGQVWKYAHVPRCHATRLTLYLGLGLGLVTEISAGGPGAGEL